MRACVCEREIKRKTRVRIKEGPVTSPHVSSWHHITSHQQPVQALLPVPSQITSQHCHQQGHSPADICCLVCCLVFFFVLSFLFWTTVSSRQTFVTCQVSPAPNVHQVPDVTAFTPPSLPPACWSFRYATISQRQIHSTYWLN